MRKSSGGAQCTRSREYIKIVGHAYAQYGMHKKVPGVQKSFPSARHKQQPLMQLQHLRQYGLLPIIAYHEIA